MTRMLVVGLGNPLLGDDGVGWRVAQQVCEQVAHAAMPVEVDCLAVGGLRLMERMIGYDHIILIDAVTTGQRPPGSLYQFPLDHLPDSAAGHLACTHDATLQTALAMGRALGAPLPDTVTVVGIECQQVHDFSDDLTSPVQAAVLPAAQAVMALLRWSFAG